MRGVIALFLTAMASCILLEGCLKKTKKATSNTDKDEMIKSDETFSNLSRKQGIKKAFIEYIDEDGILLRPNHMPMVGADAIDFLSQTNDSSYTLTWKPLGGDIASSGDLGFTYGIYLLGLTDTTLSGTYVNIWKKQADGKWKFIMNTENEEINSETPLQ